MVSQMKKALVFLRTRIERLDIKLIFIFCLIASFFRSLFTRPTILICTRIQSRPALYYLHYRSRCPLCIMEKVVTTHRIKSFETSQIRYTVYGDAYAVPLDELIQVMVQKKVTQPSAIDFWGYDDRGLADYIKSSFLFFGPKSISLFYFYFLVFGISLTLFCIEFRRDFRSLVFISIVLLSVSSALVAFLFFQTPVAIHEERAFELLSFISFIHSILFCIHEDGGNRLQRDSSSLTSDNFHVCLPLPLLYWLAGGHGAVFFRAGNKPGRSLLDAGYRRPHWPAGLSPAVFLRRLSRLSYSAPAC